MELIPIIYIVLEVTIILTILTIIISKIVNKKEPEEKTTSKENLNTNKKELLNQVQNNKFNSVSVKNVNNFPVSSKKLNQQPNNKEIKHNLNAEINNKNKRIEILNSNSRNNFNHGKTHTSRYNNEKSKKDLYDKNDHDILSKYSEEDKNLYTPNTTKKINKQNEV